ncbi:MAG: aminodeoxychorismate synthase component I [Gammaproteobacteria bacterium]|nr:aminodeoxychorismate synthase component I [Gammaproteobacteria bacterium]
MQEKFFMSPLVKTMAYQDPALVLQCFADQDWVCFFDSAKSLDELGTFSFIVFNPIVKLVADAQGQDDPFAALQSQLARYSLPKLSHLPPFQGGAAGYFSYDLLRHVENVPQHRADLMKTPDMMIGIYDTVIAFDHQAKAAWIISHGLSEQGVTPCQKIAEDKCDFIFSRLNAAIFDRALKKWPLLSVDAIQSNFAQEAYQQMVQKVIDYIYAGDIFQANVSQCFTAALPDELGPLDLYLKLRTKNPAPFAAFLDFGAVAIASASPERFLKSRTNIVETRPIKGTRPRSKDANQDQQLADALMHSDKDQAENTMITDLMRNDLSRVCADHSVVVKKLCGLETYETVHHLVSVIEGTLKPEYGAIDLLRATFPGGSITGAPKVRAMEIIADLEPTARGPYCGSIGYIGFDGDMDTSILIRTFVIKGKTVTFQAGGGIVADSVPEEEYQETLTKADSLLRVLIEP